MELALKRRDNPVEPSAERIERGEQAEEAEVVNPLAAPSESRKASMAGGRRKSAAKKSSPPDPSLIGLLMVAALSNYVPKLHNTPEFDRSHLRLGITPKGLLMVLERIGFIYWARDDDPEWKYSLNAAIHLKVANVDRRGGWKYVETYDRGRFPKIKWVDEVIGPIKKHEKLGLTNVTGYDIEVRVK